MTLPTILDRVDRAKQIKPGSYKAACPCCHSRKGRPLYITEAGDRVLLHAFCGCDTEAVLGALGLTVTDLFDKPLAPHVAPVAARIPSGEVLAALSHEATTLALIANDIQEGREVDWHRLATAAQRINHAADYINEKAR